MRRALKKAKQSDPDASEKLIEAQMWKYALQISEDEEV
jgi:hypothetical protein